MRRQVFEIKAVGLGDKKLQRLTEKGWCIELLNADPELRAAVALARTRGVDDELFEMCRELKELRGAPRKSVYTAPKPKLTVAEMKENIRRAQTA